jgi:hypothetical protein
MNKGDVAIVATQQANLCNSDSSKFECLDATQQPLTATCFAVAANTAQYLSFFTLELITDR